MKKILLLFTILFVSVITTACINNFAIQELNNKAESYLNNGDTETAICRLKSSLELDNEIYQTHYNLAVAYNSIGDYEGTVEEAQRVIELKPDFKDAYYTMAVAKEAIAYNIIEKEPDENGVISELTLDEIAAFNSKASEAVEAYNQYLVMNTNSDDSEKINNQIATLNEKIKEYTAIYDSKNIEKDKKVQEEVQNTESEQNATEENSTEVNN